MPSTRRTVLATVAAVPFASEAVAAQRGLDWKLELDGEFVDSTRLDSRTLVLSQSRDGHGIVTSIDDGGAATLFARLEHEREWESVTARDDGSLLVAGTINHDKLTVHGVGADGDLRWQHQTSIAERSFYEPSIHALADGRIGVVTKIWSGGLSESKSLYLRFLGPNGKMRGEWERENAEGEACVTREGDLLVGGGGSWDGHGGWMARFDTIGEQLWEQTWENEHGYESAVAFDSTGGVLFARYEDREELLLRDVGLDGTVRTRWTHTAEVGPEAAVRLVNGGAAFVTPRTVEHRPRFHRTVPGGGSTVFELQLFQLETRWKDVFLTKSGYVLTGTAGGTAENTLVVHITDGEGSTDHPQTPAGVPVLRSTEPPATPTFPATDTGETATETGSPEPRNGTASPVTSDGSGPGTGGPAPTNGTESGETTEGSGPGFGIASAGAAALAASLARLKTTDSE